MSPVAAERASAASAPAPAPELAADPLAAGALVEEVEESPQPETMATATRPARNANLRVANTLASVPRRTDSLLNATG